MSNKPCRFACARCGGHKPLAGGAMRHVLGRRMRICANCLKKEGARHA
jgi:hypothetical protein